MDALNARKSNEFGSEAVRRTTEGWVGNGNPALRGSPDSKSSRGKRSSRGLAAAAAAAAAAEHSRLGTLHDVFDLSMSLFISSPCAFAEPFAPSTGG